MSASSDGLSLRPLAAAAMGSSAVIMSYQVASRATRDTLFLSSFHVTSLPLMIAAASLVSIVAALLATRAFATYGPARVVPLAFLVSAVLTLGEWVLVVRKPGLGAIAFYLHVAALGPVLLSGFSSIMSERFDPRTAKRTMGRIAGVGTLGGLAGGVLAERLTAWMGISGTLPALALAHGWCAWSTSRLPSTGRPLPSDSRAALPVGEARRRLLTTPYLRNLALLVLGSSVSAALLDFVFKAQAYRTAHQSLDLMRVFSLFYTLVTILIFAMQALVSRMALERAGLARTIGTLPGAVVAGSAVAALIPGPISVGLVRGAEAVLRASLFRAGYDLLYTPVPEAEKRATKTLVDVGCDRLGDAVGAGIIVLVLLLVPVNSTPTLLVLSGLLAAGTLWVVSHLQRGYVSSLEAGLRAGAVDLDPLEVSDMTTRTAIFRALGRTGLAGPAESQWSGAFASAIPAVGWPGVEARRTVPGEASIAPGADGVLDALRVFRSNDPPRIRAALRSQTPLDDGLVPQAIRLLANDELANEIADALTRVAARHVGQLVDTLLQADTEFAVRRRIPRVLASCTSTRAVEGLTHGLDDARFEVRYRCGRALAHVIGRDPGLTVDRAHVLGAVLREASVGRQVWESQRLLDRLDERGEDVFMDAFLRDRAGRSLEHAFTLLSLVLPREPLQIAFRGIHADDRMLRGTALEYLDSVLPPLVRDALWPYLEPEPPPRRPDPQPPRDREQVLMDLLLSSETIAINLETLRKRQRDQTDPGA